MYSILILFGVTIFGSVRDLNEQGNKLYRKEKYTEALEKYKQAQVRAPEIMLIDYNIGCGQYKAEAYKEAGQAFIKIISSLEDKKLKQKAFYNLGNVLVKGGELEGAIEMYKEALKLNSNDMDAKINLELTQKLLEEAQKQPPDSTGQEQQDQKDKQQDQKDKQQEEKDKQQEEKDKQQEEKEKQQEEKFSEEAAKSLLEALQQDEKDAKEKSQKATQKGRMLILKDW